MSPAPGAAPLAVVTAAGPGGLASLRLLLDAIAEHHPEAMVLALAPTAVEALAGVEVLGWDDLAEAGVDRDELHRRAAFSDPSELLTSLVPTLLALGLQRGARVAVWVHPDIEVRAPLDDLLAAASTRGAAVVASFSSPPPDDGLRPDDHDLLTEGTVSTALVAVSGTGAGRALLDWWARRCRRDCLLDLHEGLLLDRRWLEEATRLFPVAVVDDPGTGTGWTNLHERPLSLGPDGVVHAGGVPLRAFDARGLDPTRPWLLSSLAGTRPRSSLSDDPVLAALVAERARRLREADGLTESEWPFAIAACGLPVDDHQRRFYRAALLDAEDRGRPSPPDPFDEDDPQAWVRWWAEPVGGTAEHPRNRWGEMLLGRRIDLRVAFPTPDGDDAGRLYEWVRSAGVAEGLVPPEMVPEGRPRPDPEPPMPGVNVIGFLGLDRGVGEAARVLGDAVEAAGLPLSRVDLPDPGLPPGERVLEVPPAPYDVNLLSVNPNEVVLLVNSAAHRDLLGGRRNIGLWFWEVDRLPEFMRGAFDLVDEVWVASRYDAELFRGWTDLPVEVFPHPVPIGGPTHLTRDDLGLPAGHLFGFFFDHLSILERKNPVGLVHAYTRAFGPDEGTVLVLKSINGEQRPTDVERLLLAIGDRPDIVLIDRHLSAAEMRAMYANIDAYVSLHRSEGFGQTITHAMAHGKPVIATGFSANLDYMHADNGYLVSWRPVPVGEGQDPYPPDATWADPDLDEAASWMRHVVEHPDDAAAKGARARRDIQDQYSMARAAAFVEDRLRRWW